ncbi:very short patch repair endonuclease [Chryseobacterium taichungense]|uniref:very short patch repair endonuclease n=1 Tax=Chryseobacterium taichungense TaxID=295069 RepID=UPI0028B01E47|nr:very short patch repair endonuclease [Chryseobacterium taichungense]
MAKYIFDTTPERSKLMSKIRDKDTKPEILFRKTLWQHGIRYRINVTKLPGKPDIVINRRKTIIFIDGEFWHGYKWEEKKPKIKANRDYWINKIERNMQRDVENTNKLKNLGYSVFRFWEHEIRKDLEGCISAVLSSF